MPNMIAFYLFNYIILGLVLCSILQSFLPKRNSIKDAELIFCLLLWPITLSTKTFQYSKRMIKIYKRKINNYK